MLNKSLPAPLALADIFALSPRDMAARSVYTGKAYSYILSAVEGMQGGYLKEEALAMLHTCAPGFMQLYEKKAARKKLHAKLVDACLLDGRVTVEEFMPDIEAYAQAPPPVWVASGSNYYGHHAHPGGLALHVEGNLRVALGVAEQYREMYGFAYDTDIIVFAQAVHDLAKAWVLQWLPDGSCMAQYNIADTGAHHIYGLAESMWRGIPPGPVFAQAATHVKPDSKKGRAVIAGFLQAAAMVADIDPVKYGLLDKKGEIALETGKGEYWLCYLADHSVVYNVPMARRSVEFLQGLAVNEYGFAQSALAGRDFNQFRNFVFSSLTISRVYQMLLAGGESLAAKETGKLFI